MEYLIDSVTSRFEGIGAVANGRFVQTRSARNYPNKFFLTLHVPHVAKFQRGKIGYHRNATLDRNSLWVDTRTKFILDGNDCAVLAPELWIG